MRYTTHTKLFRCFVWATGTVLPQWGRTVAALVMETLDPVTSQQAQRPQRRQAHILGDASHTTHTHTAVTEIFVAAQWSDGKKKQKWRRAGPLLELCVPLVASQEGFAAPLFPEHAPCSPMRLSRELALAPERNSAKGGQGEIWRISLPGELRFAPRHDGGHNSWRYLRCWGVSLECSVLNLAVGLRGRNEFSQAVTRQRGSTICWKRANSKKKKTIQKKIQPIYT